MGNKGLGFRESAGLKGVRALGFRAYREFCAKIHPTAALGGYNSGASGYMR